MPLSFIDNLKIVLILCGAAAVVWVFMIHPYSYDWERAGETTASVKTLMSNSKVLGAPQINAVVRFETGGEAVITIPLRSDVRAGDRVLLEVDQDAKKPTRKRYRFVKEIS